MTATARAHIPPFAATDVATPTGSTDAATNRTATTTASAAMPYASFAACNVAATLLPMSIGTLTHRL